MKKRNIGIILVSLVVGGLMFYAGNAFYAMMSGARIAAVPAKALSAQEKSLLLDQAHRGIYEIMKIPAKIDAVTTLYEVSKDEENFVIIYHYSIVTLTNEALIAAKDSILNRAIQTVCNVPESKALIDSGIAMQWKYYTPDKQLIMQNTFEGPCEV